MSDFDSHKIKKREKRKRQINFDRPNVFFDAIHHFIEGFVKERIKKNEQQKKESLYLDRIFHEKSFVGLFFRKVKNLFVKEQEKERQKPPIEKEELKLIGRIRELDKNIEESLDVLNVYKEDLKKEVDEDLYPFLESVMNPMLRDILRIQKIVKKEGMIHKKVEDLNQYDAWIDRAKSFIQVCSTSKNKQVIEKAILKHTLEDFKNLIDKDLHLIQDYERHVVDELEGIKKGEKAELQKKIKKSIKPYLKSLINLKNEPKHLTIENLNEWKEEADRSRSSYFNAVLQTIDNKAKKFNLKEEISDGSDFLMELLTEVTFLEEEIPRLINQLKKTDLGDEEFNELEREVTVTELLALKQEVDELYHDIKIPQELIKRLFLLKKLVDKNLLES